MNTGIICASIGQTRQSHKISLELEEMASQWEDFNASMIDLADYPLSLTDQSELVKKLEQFDNFILVFDEKTQSYPLALRMLMENAAPAFEKKIAAIAMVTDDPKGANSAFHQLQLALLGLKAIPLSTRLTVERAAAAFDHNLELLDRLLATKMTSFMETFLSFFREPRRAQPVPVQTDKRWMRLAQ